ncbi:hypothetical protein BV22DRAFT_1042808 [Leucogyrophana mollusca]|uniref:Uncharacterized protein n=1 Tax=Leucogyrophana mollusca TaxID=85980 RepID=A0ACB8BZ84_9AGAM|nr:hypothetical protein BV22DRAFT_1042808 [Leucogyrophana mollusca]
MPLTQTPFIRILTEVMDNMFDVMALDVLQSFGSACKAHRKWVIEYLRRRKRCLLAKFIADLASFDDTLRATSSVISGSVALQFLLPQDATRWPSTDLDIYTTAAGYKGVADALLCEKYILISTGSSRPCYTQSTIRTVFTFAKGGLRIDVVISASACAILPIFQFHSTIVMNYLSADSFFSAYPLFTNQFRGLVNPMSMKDGRHTMKVVCALVKYENRGFSINASANDWESEDEEEHECRDNVCCPHYIRATNDVACARVVLEESASVQSEDWDAGDDVVMWRLGGETCDEADNASVPYVFVL